MLPLTYLWSVFPNKYNLHVFNFVHFFFRAKVSPCITCLELKIIFFFSIIVKQIKSLILKRVVNIKRNLNKVFNLNVTSNEFKHKTKPFLLFFLKCV